MSLPVWWPGVYFEVRELGPGGEHGIGKLISLRAGGWLPYTLRINFRITETRYPNGFSMDRAALALYFAYYNFCRMHKTLRCTPAMAAGVVDHVWTLKHLLITATSF